MVAAERRAQATVVAAEVRHQRAGELHELAVTAQRASEKADAAEERAAESEGVVEAERRTVHDRRSACHAAEAEWAATMREWTRSGVAADSGADWSDVHARLDHGRDDIRWPDDDPLFSH